MSKFFSNHDHQKGQSLAELAISMVVLLVLIAGIFDVGRAILTYLSMRDAVQEGASYATVVFDSKDTSAVHSDKCVDIVRRTQENIDDSNTAITVTLNGDDCTSASITSDACSGNEAIVTANLPFPLTMPFIGSFLGTQSITLEASATSTILRPYCK